MSASSGINPADIVTAAGFLAVVIGAMAVHVVKANAKESPRARMLKRAVDAAAPERAPGSVVAEPDSVLRVNRTWSNNRFALLAVRLKADVHHISGMAGLNWMAGTGVLAAVAAAALLKLAGLSAWFNLALTPLGMIAGASAAFMVLRKLYRRRFLETFPDALELIIRAVRAGVPVVQAIRTAGKELPGPVGREFGLIGDTLRLGLDQDEVLAAAALRIGLADFRFFSVCLQLQRETGGPLAETLENLASIIRARREVQLKTRALTAQGRMSSKIIATVPVVTLGALQMIGDHYLDILFDTPSGHTVLWVAGSMVLGGLLIIARMAKLED